MEKTRSSRVKSNSSRNTLLLGLLASSILAGAGSLEVQAEEGLNFKNNDVESVDDETLRENALQQMQDIQNSKEERSNRLTRTQEGYALDEELTNRILDAITYEEVNEDDTETVKRLKQEQRILSTLIEEKYADAESLGEVVNQVAGESLGSNSLARGVTVTEGQGRLDEVILEVDTLIGVKEIVDADLADAIGIQGEILGLEDEIRAQLGGDFDFTEGGDMNIEEGYIEYLNTLVSSDSNYQLRSSFVHQTSSNSKVLASYFGQSEELDALIAEGVQYLDQRYVWGGESLSEGGFDCSGLMYRIFKDSLGINLPRVSQDQQNFGTKVALSDIKPGDLVFWNTPATHVALYLGNGKILEAANPSAGLRVRDVRLSELSSATRIKDFGVEDSKDTVVHITNSRRTVSYTPIFNGEQSREFNNSVSNTVNGGQSQAEIDAELARIEQNAKQEQARVDATNKAKAEQEAKDKAKSEQEAKEKDKAKSEQEAKDKAKAEQEAKDKAKAEQEAKDKAKAEQEAKEKAEAEKKAQEERDRKQAEEEAKKQAELEAEEARKQQEQEAETEEAHAPATASLVAPEDAVTEEGSE